MRQIYLDNAATTPLLPEVRDEVIRSLTEDFGNPSSLHRLGLQSERRIKESRNSIAQLMNVPADSVIFTSGGTEANNLAILGTTRARKRYGNHCITTQIEHSSVLNTFTYLESEGWDVSYLPVDNQGLLDLKDLEKAIRKDTVLVSIGHVNSEIGSVQPISRIGQFLKANYPDIIFHSDAVQSFGKLRLRPVDWGIDLLSASGHKVHAPKGIGILYIKKGTPLTTLQWGGGQEMGIRSGTENLTGIVGFGKAAQLIYEFMDREDDTISKMKMTLAKGISEAVQEAVINGPRPDEGAPHILNISIPGIRGETLLHVLESHGVYVSTGSACSSRRTKISHVLEAIGAPIQIAEGAIRLSLSYMSDPEELLLVPDILRKSVDQVKRFTRR